MGSFRWDAITNRVTWSDELYRIYGRTPAEFGGTYEAFLSYVHPDDLAAVQDAVQRTLRDRVPFRVRERILRPDGKLRTLDSAGEVVVDAAGDVVGLLGVCRDITEDESAHAAVQESEARLRAFIESMDDVAFEIDEHGTYLSIWTRNEEMLPRSREEMLGRRVESVFGEEWARPLCDAFRRVLATGSPETIEYSWDAPGGRRWFSGRVSRIRAEQGGSGRVCVLVRETTDRRRADEALRELSGRLVEAEDRERRLIARELHDATSPLLTSLLTKLHGVRREAEGVARERLIAESLKLAEHAAEIIRSVSYVLHPPMVDTTRSLAGLQWYANRLAAQAGIHVQVEAPADLPRLSEDAELALFGVVRGFLMKVPRRSGGRRATVRVAAGRESVKLEMSDDGRALPPEVLEDLQSGGGELGVAFASLRERMRQLGGGLEITSGPHGTLVRAILPWSRQPPQ